MNLESYKPLNSCRQIDLVYSNQDDNQQKLPQVR